MSRWPDPAADNARSPFTDWHLLSSEFIKEVDGQSVFREKAQDTIRAFDGQRWHTHGNAPGLTGIRAAFAGVWDPETRPGVQLVLIDQMGSGSELSIAKLEFGRLCAFYGVAPIVTNLMRQFRRRSTPVHQLGYAFERSRHGAGDRQVFSYLLPHCEPDNPELAVDGRNIWRAREIGVYHQFSLEKRQHVFFVIHPSKKVRKRIEEFMVLPRTAKRDDAWEMIHALVLSSTCSLWPRYVDATEAHFQALNTQLFSATVQPELVHAAEYHVTEEDIRQSNDLVQVIQRTSLALDHSISIISALHLLLLQPVSSSAATGQASSSPSSTPGLIPPTTTTTPPSSHSLPSLTAAHPESDIQFFLTNLRNLLHTQQSRLSALEPRLESTTSVIHSFQSLHNLLELRSLNEKALTTQKESEARASASEARAQAAASDAARTERLTLIVAVISILYLPANFSAQLFGMQYVHVWEDGIVFDMGIRAWGVLTVVLTAMTAVAFAVYEWRGMSKGRRKERMAVVGKWARCGCC